MRLVCIAGYFPNVSFNSFVSPDPDHIRGGPGIILCVKKSSHSEQYFSSYASGQTDRQTNPNALLSHSFPGARVTIYKYIYIYIYIYDV